MLEALNSNKFFLGAAMILLNVGSRHLVDEYSDNPEEYDRNILLRRLAIFAVCFVGTRDVVVSLLLTAAFVILAQGMSRKSREGMRNRGQVEVKTLPTDPGGSRADQPAYDTTAPRLFASS